MYNNIDFTYLHGGEAAQQFKHDLAGALKRFGDIAADQTQPIRFAVHHGLCVERDGRGQFHGRPQHSHDAFDPVPQRIDLFRPRVHEGVGQQP